MTKRDEITRRIMIHLTPKLSDRNLPAPPAVEALRPADPGVATSPAPWVRGLQDMVVNVPREATRLEMLVGMGAGALFFQAGRVLGLRALLLGGVHGRAALWLGRGAGLAAEATGFMAASRGALRAMGQAVTEDWGSLGREWLSMAFFLGAMRSAQGTLRHVYGPGRVPTTAWQSFQLGLAEQGAMYGALVGTAAAEWSWGWRDYQNKTHLLGESLALLGSFQLGGALAQATLGRRLQPVTQALEARAIHWERAASHPMPPDLPWLKTAPLTAGATGPALDLGAERVFHIIGTGGEGGGEGGNTVPAPTSERMGPGRTATFKVIGPAEILRMISGAESEFISRLQEGDVIFQLPAAMDTKVMLPKMHAALDEVPQNQSIISGRKIFFILNVGDGQPLELAILRKTLRGFEVESQLPRPFASEDPIRPSSDAIDAILMDTATAAPSREEIPTPRPPQESSLLNIGEGDLPIMVGSFLELSRKVRNDPDSLQTDLMARDRAVQMETPLGFRMDFALNLLNGLPRLAEIPAGRTVTYHLKGREEPRIALKQGEQFVDASHRALRATPPSTRRRRTPRPEADSSPTSTVSVASESKAGATGPWEAKHLPTVFQDLNSLAQLMGAVVQKHMPGTYPSLILDGRSVTATQLNGVTAGKLSDLEEGSAWQILVPANKKASRIFLGSLQGGTVQWNVSSGNAWKRAEAQSVFSTHIVSDPVEIFLHLEAISRDKKRSSEEQTQFQHRGQWTPDYLEGLGSFILGALNRYPIRGNSLLLTSQEGQTLLEYRNEAGKWERTPTTSETEAGTEGSGGAL